MEFLKKHAFFLLGGACLVIVGVIFIVTRGGSGAEILRDGDVLFDAQGISGTEGISEPSYIMVHVAGEVNSPGVFKLPPRSRVNDALEMAGGATEYANLTRINLVDFLQDAMQIIVPAHGDYDTQVFVFGDGGGSAGAPQTGITADGLVNINIASRAELETLSGIGPTLAQNIIDFRETHGHFSSVEELINVSGIGDTRLANLRNHVTVN